MLVVRPVPDQVRGFPLDSDLALAAMRFFENGGSQLWVVRTAHHAKVSDPASVTATRAAGFVVAGGGPSLDRVPVRKYAGVNSTVAPAVSIPRRTLRAWCAPRWSISMTSPERRPGTRCARMKGGNTSRVLPPSTVPDISPTPLTRQGASSRRDAPTEVAETSARPWSEGTGGRAGFVHRRIGSAFSGPRV